MTLRVIIAQHLHSGRLQVQVVSEDKVTSVALKLLADEVEVEDYRPKEE